MSEKLPEGWTDDDGHGWRHSGGAGASVHRMENRWRAVVVGVERARQAEAETDRLNMIAGLDGRTSPDLEAAQKEIDTLYARLEAGAERHDAVVEKLDALGVPHCGGLVERIEALADRSADKDALIKLGVELRSVRTERDNLRSNAAFTSSCIDNARALRVERDAAMAKVAQLETRRAGDYAEHKALTVERDAALAKVATLTAEVKTLTEAREYLERNIGELEDRRDADEEHVADLELELSEARLGHDAAEKRLEESECSLRRALTNIMGLRTERDNLRHTIATQQARIDGLTAEASDKAPQLLRDSMRVTQEENARLRAEVSALTAKGITFEAALSRHHDNHARTVQERNTCMARMELLRADLAKVTGERDALLKDRSLTRLERAFSEVEKENESMKADVERMAAEIATLTTRATAAEGYAQHLLAALNAVSGFRGMP